MCGIVAIKNVSKAIELAVVGAHELQHRARTYVGGVSCDGQHFYPHAGKGLAREIFNGSWLNRLHGKDALVHVRYPTLSDADDRDNTQPIKGIYMGEEFWLAHNGNLTNKEALQRHLRKNSKLATAIDSEYIVRLLEQRQTGDIEADLSWVLNQLEGSFELLFHFADKMVAVRDPRGNHPLSLGLLNGGYCVASETCAFPLMRARHEIDIEAGTMIIIENTGYRVSRYSAPKQQKKCVFELLYFSNVASKVFGVGVTRFRQDIGEELQRLFPVEGGADLVVTPIPDSGNPYAKGFGRTTGSDFQVIWRNHYVGRTFNAATQALRDEEVSRKFIFDAEEIAGKRVVLLDDSIVRGTTLPKIVEMMWWLGAKEVHARIATPPITQVCRYGIYMDEDQTELVSGRLSPAEIAAAFNATSIEFLPLPVLKSLLKDPENYCFTCMGEAYW